MGVSTKFGRGWEHVSSSPQAVARRATKALLCGSQFCFTACTCPPRSVCIVGACQSPQAAHDKNRPSKGMYRQ